MNSELCIFIIYAKKRYYKQVILTKNLFIYVRHFRMHLLYEVLQDHIPKC